MSHGIDTSFRLRKEERAKMRRRARWRNALAGLGALLLIVALAALYLSRGYWTPQDYEGDLQPVEAVDVIPPDAAVYVPAIVDLAGDPMWINIAQEGGTDARRRSMARPADLADSGVSTKVEYLSDTMLSSSERFMTSIPSSQEDFAFFEAQRGVQSQALQSPATGSDTPLPQADGPGAEGPDADLADPGAGWGETIDEGESALPAFQKTAVEDNTTVATVVAEEQRFQATDDIFVKVLTARSLESVATEAHFAPGEAKLANEALKSLFQMETLEPGYVVAMRSFRPRKEAAAALMQVSIYARSQFVGTLARNAAGQFVSGVDPWVRDDLFNYSGAPDAGVRKRQYRLLDAIYSTAARNNVPTGVLGEAIMYLSRGEDLNAFATEDQRLVLLYSDTARGKDGLAGRVLYVGVRGDDKNLECFVFQQGDGEFACVTQNDEVRSAMVANGMVTPVKGGVMTSTFGPRMHPILKTVRIHKGVDWAAPVGTPIAAAFDGQVVFEGDGQGYGNLIRITHSDNRETRYAHMQRFAEGIAVGSTVKAGDVIGYVGTTGLSTGPHLHFELYQYGQVIDPLGTVTVVASSDPAVELLTDRIVHVESGGSARAKNPLSSATGLGQFISTTWIRMMNTYRPDLARSLSTEELLALRYDATISREMVRNLAREGEAYLKARGHQITAGRLYLSHFLGMEGANQVLSAPGDAMLVDLLGVSVIRANPFLTGKNASYVIAWAERKMGTRVIASPAATPAKEIVQASPEFEKYKQVIAATLTLADNTL